MTHEIEAKIKVSELVPTEARLKEIGAIFMHDIHQVDTYFMDTHKLLHKNDCGLRIRRQVTDGTETALITFKGARKQSRYKSRSEYETGIDNAETAEKIFEALGYHKHLTVRKQRSVWRLDDCEICLDELPELGCFVEVEGPTEHVIKDVLRKLGFENQPHTSESYAHMIGQITNPKIDNETRHTV